MNILISSTKLADVARTAVRAVRHYRDSKSPILNCCRLTAGGNLSIYGTDLDTGIAAAAECDVIEPGEAAVDAQRLADIAAKLKGDVCINHTANDLVIKCGRSRFALTTQPLEDAPTPLAADVHAPAIAFGAADVMPLFAGAATGAASGDARPYLNGVAIFSEPRDFGHRLCAVGTDSVMLSYAATMAACPDLGEGVIVHRDTCKLAVELFGKIGATLRLSENLIEIASDNARLAAKLVGHRPTAWHSMVPPIDLTNSALVANAYLKAALKRCLAVTDDLAKRAPNVTLWWRLAAGGEIRIALGDIENEAPAARDHVPAVELTGNVDVSLNPQLLLRLLDGLDAGNIRTSASEGHGTPLRIDAGPDRFAVLCAIREFSHIGKNAGNNSDDVDHEFPPFYCRSNTQTP